MNERKRFRLYKAGKCWLVGMMVASLAFPGITIVHAAGPPGDGPAAAVRATVTQNIIRKPIIFLDFLTGQEVGRAVTNVPYNTTYVIMPPRGYALVEGESKDIQPTDEKPKKVKVHSTENKISKNVDYWVGSSDNKKIIESRTVWSLPFTKIKLPQPSHPGYELRIDNHTLDFSNTDSVMVEAYPVKQFFRVNLVHYETGAVLKSFEAESHYGTQYNIAGFMVGGYHFAPGESDHILIGTEKAYTVQVIPPVAKLTKTLIYWEDDREMSRKQVSDYPGESYYRGEYVPHGFELANDQEAMGTFADEADDHIQVTRKRYHRTVHFVKENGSVLDESVVTGMYEEEKIIALPEWLESKYEPVDVADLVVKMTTEKAHQVTIKKKIKENVVNIAIDYYCGISLIQKGEVQTVAIGSTIWFDPPAGYKLAPDQAESVEALYSETFVVELVEEEVQPPVIPVTLTVHFKTQVDGPSVATHKATGQPGTTQTVPLPAGYHLQDGQSLTVVLAAGEHTILVTQDDEPPVVEPPTAAVTTTVQFKTTSSGLPVKTQELTGPEGATQIAALPSGYALQTGQSLIVTLIDGEHTILVTPKVEPPVIEPPATQVTTKVHFKTAVDQVPVKTQTLTGPAGTTQMTVLPKGYHLQTGQSLLVTLADGEQTILVSQDHVPPDIKPPVNPPGVKPPITVPPVTPPVTEPPVAAEFALRPVHQIVYVNDQAILYSDLSRTAATGRILPWASAWQSFNEVLDKSGAVVGYHLGGAQYVHAADVQTQSLVDHGVFTVRYPAQPTWQIAVLDQTGRPVKLIQAGSRWQTFGQRQLITGRWYYHLGGDQYVPVDYGTWEAR